MTNTASLSRLTVIETASVSDSLDLSSPPSAAGGDHFTTARASRFAALTSVPAAQDPPHDLEAVQRLIRKLSSGRTTALRDSKSWIDTKLVEEMFGSRVGANRPLFLELARARADLVADLAPRDAPAVLRLLLRGANSPGIEDPSRIVDLLEASRDAKSAEAALEQAFPPNWTVLRSGDQLVATRSNGQSFPQPLQIHYQRHGADCYRISIGGQSRSAEAYAMSILVTDSGSAVLVAPRRIELEEREAQVLPALNRALLEQAPALSFDELALRRKRPDLVVMLDQTVSVLGNEMRLGDALERAVQESSLWAAEEFLIPAAGAEESTDMRLQILSAMANRFLPGKFAGRSGIVNKFFELRAEQYETEMDELAALAGDPPFRLREAVQNSQDLIGDLIGEVLNQASGDSAKIEQLRQDAVARAWAATAQAMPGEESGGTIGALLGLFSED